MQNGRHGRTASWVASGWFSGPLLALPPAIGSDQDYNRPSDRDLSNLCSADQSAEVARWNAAWHAA
jgi:hypothetical protein